MDITRRKFSLAGSAALITGFPAIVSAQAEGKIILGQSAPFTGPAAQLGIQFYRGAKVYLDQPERCAENTRKLIADDVFALFGYIGTPTSVVALPLATKAKIPFIAPFTGAMSLRDPFNKYAFHVRGSYNDETALIVKQLTSLGLKKIAVFHQNDAYGKAGLDGGINSRGTSVIHTIEQCVEGQLACGDRHGRVGGNLCCDLGGMRKHVVPKFVDQSEPRGRTGITHPCGIEAFCSPCSAENGHHTVYPRERIAKTQACRRHAELCTGRGIAEIAGQSQTQTTAITNSADGCDHRAGELLKRALCTRYCCFISGDAGSGIALRIELGNVGARDKSAVTITAQDHNAYLAV
eukprot:gene43676-biopygen34845